MVEAKEDNGKDFVKVNIEFDKKKDAFRVDMELHPEMLDLIPTTGDTVGIESCRVDNKPIRSRYTRGDNPLMAILYSENIVADGKISVHYTSNSYMWDLYVDGMRKILSDKFKKEKFKKTIIIKDKELRG
jgi:hypothetical protein